MTALETVRFVEMMLDDSIDWYFPDILKAINEAQIYTVRKYYAMQNERALRTLYRKDQFLQLYDTIYYRDALGQKTTPAVVMYPRSARVYEDETFETNSYTANYIDYFHYINNQFPRYESFDGNLNTRFPKTVYYTLHKLMNNGTLETQIYFNAVLPGSRIDIWYIKQPETFNVDYVLPIDVPLELPAEFHPEIASLAAEMLNDIDVNERERGDITFQNQKLNLTNPSGGA